LKKIAQSMYGRSYGLNDPRVRIPVRASVFCSLQKSGLAVGPTKPPGYYVLVFFTGDKAAEA
jgi:hypothetical protein